MHVHVIYMYICIYIYIYRRQQLRRRQLRRPCSLPAPYDQSANWERRIQRVRGVSHAWSISLTCVPYIEWILHLFAIDSESHGFVVDQLTARRCLSACIGPGKYLRCPVTSLHVVYGCVLSPHAARCHCYISYTYGSSEMSRTSYAVAIWSMMSRLMSVYTSCIII